MTSKKADETASWWLERWRCTTCHCQKFPQEGTKASCYQTLFTSEVWAPPEVGRQTNKIACTTHCRIVILSSQVRNDFKPFSNRRASLSALIGTKWIDRRGLVCGYEILRQMFGWFLCIFSRGVVLPLDEVILFASSYSFCDDTLSFGCLARLDMLSRKHLLAN